MTTEEVKQTPGETAETPQPPEESSPSKKVLDIKRSLAEIDAERNERDQQQRFGYFSVLYPSTVGDQAYSQKQEYHHKIEAYTLQE